MSESIVLYAGDGQLELHRNQLMAMLNNPCTLSILFVDSSSSMARYGKIPQDSVNGHFESLLDPPDRREQYCCVFTFANNPKVHLPITKASDIQPMSSYMAKGWTRQWRTVDEGMQAFLMLYKSLPEESRQNLQIVVGVFSDGQDNLSNTDENGNKMEMDPYPLLLQDTSREALIAGWELFSFGIGIDAKKMAREMGFPDDHHAVTVEATAKGVEEATRSFSVSTTTIGMGIPDPKDLETELKRLRNASTQT